MKKLITSAALLALCASPALATDSEPQKIFEIESPDIEVTVDGPEIKDKKTAKKRHSYMEATYYNVADIIQTGVGNKAKITQNEGYGYHADKYNLNGSWTIQVGAFNKHIGNQGAYNGAWNMAKIKQIGFGNHAYTDQYAKDYGQNVLSGTAIGAFNVLLADQDIHGGSYDHNPHYASPSVNILSAKQIGFANFASAKQNATYGGGNFGEIKQVGAFNAATLVQNSNQ